MSQEDVSQARNSFPGNDGEFGDVHILHPLMTRLFWPQISLRSYLQKNWSRILLISNGWQFGTGVSASGGTPSKFTPCFRELYQGPQVPLFVLLHRLPRKCCHFGDFICTPSSKHQYIYCGVGLNIVVDQPIMLGELNEFTCGNKNENTQLSTV